MKNLIWSIISVSIFCMAYLSCAPKCEDCPQQSSDKIIVDEVDTGIVEKANYIVIDEVNTAYIKNAKTIIIDNVENAFVDQSGRLYISRKTNAIIVDEVDTGIYKVPIVAENPLQKIIDKVRNDDDDDDDDKNQN